MEEDVLGLEEQAPVGIGGAASRGRFILRLEAPPLLGTLVLLALGSGALLQALRTLRRSSNPLLLRLFLLGLVPLGVAAPSGLALGLDVAEEPGDCKVELAGSFLYSAMPAVVQRTASRRRSILRSVSSFLAMKMFTFLKSPEKRQSLSQDVSR